LIIKITEHDFEQKKDTCFKTQGAPENCNFIRNYEKAEKLCPKCNCIIDESEDPNQPQDFFIENKKQHQFRLPKRIENVLANFRIFISIRMNIFRGNK